MSKNVPTLETLLSHVVQSCRLQISPVEAGEKTLLQLGLDSLELMGLAIELEDNFGLLLEVEGITGETKLAELLSRILGNSSA